MLMDMESPTYPFIQVLAAFPDLHGGIDQQEVTDPISHFQLPWYQPICHCNFVRQVNVFGCVLVRYLSCIETTSA